MDISKILYNQLAVPIPKQQAEVAGVSASEISSYNQDFLSILKQIYDTKQELTAISLKEYQQVFSTLLRDEI